MPASKTSRHTFKDVWTSERLIYRAIEENDDDRSIYTKLIANDPAVRATFFLDEALKPQTQDKVKDRMEKHRQGLISVFVCISSMNNEGMKPIGIVALHSCSALHQRADLGIAVGSAYQRKGYGSEAIECIVNWAFQSGNLHRIGRRCASFNPRALKAYERIGFIKEGTQREAIWSKGEWHAVIGYGMLGVDWSNLRGKSGSMVAVVDVKDDASTSGGSSNDD